MQNSNEIKNIVKEKYGQIAARNNSASASEKTGCCCKSNKIVGYTIMKDDYDNLAGYNPDADLGLGCGLPTEFAAIKEGDTVVDLGCGAGNDVFVARAITGSAGKVIGIDMTEEMIEKANSNKSKLGFQNVEFKLGEIENLPLEKSSVDVVVSNCVLNLVPDKQKAFDEIHRVLKPGGHFCVSDIVIKGELPAGLKKSAEMYAGCVAGAVGQEQYLNHIYSAGFVDAEIKKSKVITLPDEILNKYLNEDEIKNFHANNVGIFSITITAVKK